MTKKQQAQTPPPAQAPAPQKQGMSTGAKVAIGFGIGCLVIIIIGLVLFALGCNKVVKEVEKAASQTPTPTPSIQYTFDATSLLGKSVNDIRITLGEPTTTKKSEAVGKSLSDEYVKGDASLRYDYTAQSDVITKFYLVLAKNGTMDNYVKTYNLKTSDPKYEVLFATPVRPEDKAKFVGEGSDYMYASVELK